MPLLVSFKESMSLELWYVVYDYEKCIKILMDRDGMEEDEADEYLQFNTVGAWVGKGTPAFMYPMTLDQFKSGLELEEL